MKTTSETTAKRQLSQLQAAIIDGLEDIKAQNIQVFDTTELSPLFERVIVASATSSRQTKALAASVRDKIKEAGFDKPRIEGEDNGEWVIVDCGTIVVHVMQPAIREYYRLEEIWGDKPVKATAAAKKAAKKLAKAVAGDDAADAKPARKTAKATTGGRSTGAASAARKSAAKPTAAKKSAARKAAAAPSATTKKLAVKPASAPSGRTPATAARKTASAPKQAATKTAAAKTTATKKTGAKKTAAKRTTKRMPG